MDSTISEYLLVKEIRQLKLVDIFHVLARHTLHQSHNLSEFDSQIVDNLPLAAFRCFEAAARLESFTLAADELGLTHGAVSRAVKSVEDHVGMLLFDRRNRRVYLTDAGRTLSETISVSFSSIRATVRELRRRSSKGTIVLSCESTLLMRWLIPALPEFHAEHPDISLQLVAASEILAFEREGADVAIRRGQSGWLDDMSVVPFMEEWLGPVCSPRFAARQGLPETGTSGLSGSALLQARTNLSAWAQWAQLAGSTPQNTASEIFDHPYLTLQAAASGLGIAIGSHATVKHDLESGVLVAPFGFYRDVSNYNLLIPARIADEPRICALSSWLEQKARRDLQFFRETGRWTMHDTFKDHFSSVSMDYAAFRPSYPRELSDYIGGIAESHDAVLDCGCGAGQLSTLLADRFKRVVATDASEEQLKNAKPHPRITYRLAVAEQSGLEDASVDVVTVAQAAHWFELDSFYAEVRRVLRPGGAIVLITYGVIEADGEVGRIISHFYFDVIGHYWPPERRHVETRYQSLPFPFAEAHPPAMSMSLQWSVDELLGYIDTWSALRNAEDALGRLPFENFSAKLRAAWGDPGSKREIRWPLSMRVGHVERD